MKNSRVHVVVLALRDRTRAFYAGGVGAAFGGDDPLDFLFDTLATVSALVDIITDCPADARERWLTHGATRPLSVRVHQTERKNWSAVLSEVLRIGRKTHAILVLDASAPLVESETIRKLLGRLRHFPVVYSETRTAVALRREALATASVSARRADIRSLADWIDTAVKETSGKRPIAMLPDGFTHEGPLNSIERIYAAVAEHRLHRVLKLVARGLGVTDPRTLDLRGVLKFGRNVTIGPNVQIAGEVVLGDNVSIGPNCLIENARVGADCTIKEFTTVSGARVGPRCRLGPYARIRPDSRLGAACQIGNFVEIKASKLGAGCKINHHSFIGDAFLSNDVIVGAGSVTCNYDGAKTQQTWIGRGAFVGSGVMMIAPLKIGRRAFVAAGSTITKVAPAGALTIARAKQVFVAHWHK